MEYHDITGHVSNSGLSILEKSPREFKKFLDGTLEKKDTSYYAFGTATHMALLEPDKYEKEVVAIDYTIPRSQQQKDFIANFLEHRKNKVKIKDASKKAFENNYKPTKNWEEKTKELLSVNKGYIKYLKQSANKLVLSPNSFKRIQTIKEEVKGHRIASKCLIDPLIIDDGVDRYNELQILWEYHGIKCKSMLDRLLVDKENKRITIVDLKTTSNVSEFNTSFWKYNYHRQLIYYSLALYYNSKEVLGVDKSAIIEYDIEFVIVAADKYSTEVRTYKLSKETIDKALIEVRALLNRAKWHIDNNKWEHPMEYYLDDGYETL